MDEQQQQSHRAQLSKQKERVEEANAAWVPKAHDKKVPIAERQKLKAEYNQARRELIRLEGLEEASERPSELLQVWFPGVHINIGGGSSDTLAEKGDLEGESSCLPYLFGSFH
jgi:sRNA-binding protein